MKSLWTTREGDGVSRGTDSGAGSDLRVAGSQNGPVSGSAGQAGFGLVEALVAVVILAVGLLAVAGITLSVAQQSRDASYRTGQVMAAEQVLEDRFEMGFHELQVGETDTTVTVGPRTFDVTVEVTQPFPRFKEIRVAVPAGPTNLPEQTLSARVHEPENQPSAP